MKTEERRENSGFSFSAIGRVSACCVKVKEYRFEVGRTEGKVYFMDSAKSMHFS